MTKLCNQRIMKHSMRNSAFLKSTFFIQILVIQFRDKWCPCVRNTDLREMLLKVFWARNSCLTSLSPSSVLSYTLPLFKDLCACALWCLLYLFNYIMYYTPCRYVCLSVCAYVHVCVCIFPDTLQKFRRTRFTKFPRGYRSKKTIFPQNKDQSWMCFYFLIRVFVSVNVCTWECFVWNSASEPGAKKSNYKRKGRKQKHEEQGAFPSLHSKKVSFQV